jgi:signal transduction histidine kinase
VSPRTVFLVLLSALLAAPTAAAGFSFRYRLVDVFRSSGASADWRIRACDLNGDGDDDFLRSTSGRALCEVYVRAHRTFETFRDITLDSAGSVQGVGDATGDGRADLLVVISRDSVCWVACHDLRRPGGADRPLWTAGPYLDSCRLFVKMGTRGHVSVLGVFDADADGRPEVYLDVQPYAPGGEPRKIVCLDGPTGRERWRYLLAAATTRLQLLTRRGGRERHLIVQSYAPDNGFQVGDETDATAYVTSLSPQGRKEWSGRMGGIFSGAWVVLGDFDGDGERDVLVSATITAAQTEADSSALPVLCVLDPGNGRILRSARIPSAIVEPVAEDLDGDGRDEIVGAGQDQSVYCYDSRLALRWVNRQRKLMSVTWIGDLDGDAAPEILAGSPGSIGVLDTRGHLLLGGDVAGNELNMSPMRLAGRIHLLLVGERQSRVAAVERPDVSPAVMVLVGGPLTAGLGGAGYLVRRRRRRAAALVEQGEAQDHLLEAMVAFGHAGSSLGILDRLHFYLKNWDRVRAQDGVEGRLAPLLDDFVGSVLPDLVRLVSLARRARVRPQYWRLLATQALQVSGELQQLVERGPAVSNARVQRAEAAVESLDADLRGIRAHLRQVFHADVEPLARRVLARRAAEFASAGVEVRLEDRGPASQAAFVAGGQLEKVLENLVENALRAMQEAAVRRLGVTLTVEGAHCLIDVSDSGCGIPPQDRERVFDRDYSTREGGGFGLYYARQVLARYEGKTFVLASGPGEGTTFRIVLRTS